VQQFGHATVVNLVGLLGYFAMVAMTLNVFAIGTQELAELPFAK
jgi:4-carboxymuconolactone decarboxylase